MLISLCIPVHNRTHDLKLVMPHLIEAANSSPPVEIVIVDYNSPDDLAQYVRGVMQEPLGEVGITYRKYTGRDHYHMAHARNLTIQLAHGEVVVISSADIWFTPKYFTHCRSIIGSYDFLRGSVYKGVIMAWRDVLIQAGGYDERFEFYSPEDTDLERRLLRRGCRMGYVPNGMIRINPTPDDIKVKNYHEELTKAEMAARMHPILVENDANGVLIANEGREWGIWQ